MDPLNTQQFTPALPSSQLSRNDAFYEKVPHCWDNLSQNERDNAVGWVEVFDEAIQEFILFANQDFTVGTGQQCTYQLDWFGMPQVFFTFSKTITKLMLISSNNSDQLIRHEKMFIKMPDFRTTFTVHKLEIAIVIPEETTDEYNQKVGRRFALTTKDLGRGRTGTVRLAFDFRTHQRVAVKVLRHGRNNEYIRNEARTLSTVRGYPYFINAVKVIATARKTYFVLNYMRGGNLTSYINRRGPLPEMEVKDIFRQLFEGVFCLYTSSIAHGDIKPDNILLDMDCQFPEIAYTDFGTTHRAICAPEVILSSHLRENILAAARAEEDQTIYNKLTSPPLSIHGYDTPIDMWSLGVILYEMLLGHCPYDGGQSAYKYIKNILQTPLDFGQENQLSSEAIELIKQLLDINKRTRLTAEDALNSPWFDDMREANATEINEQINI
ncbi:kinase-like domain-containing protein [Syncephalis fuscata]|nr:kinase-like domain-containing protein [Syncephalis fuscata]